MDIDEAVNNMALVQFLRSVVFMGRVIGPESMVRARVGEMNECKKSKLKYMFYFKTCTSYELVFLLFTRLIHICGSFQNWFSANIDGMYYRFTFYLSQSDLELLFFLMLVIFYI